MSRDTMVNEFHSPCAHGLKIEMVDMTISTSKALQTESRHSRARWRTLE